MQEASNSSVWQLSDFQEAPRMIAIKVWPDHLAQVTYRFKLGKGLVIIVLAIKLCIKHCGSSHATKFAQ